MEDSSKVINFIDVGGHERYAKKMVRGLCANYPDYALIVVDAFQCFKNGIQVEKSVLDNFCIAFAFKVPVIIVLTKTDMIKDKVVLEDIVYELRT
jgi:elongation factor 1-alpha